MYIEAIAEALRKFPSYLDVAVIDAENLGAEVARFDPQPIISSSSIPTNPVIPSAYNLDRALPRAQPSKFRLGERMRLAGLWQGRGLVFPSQVGTPLSARYLRRHFKALLKRAGLPQTTRFHDLRHTCATLLLRQGVNPKFVQELLGHGDVSVTLNVYSYVLPDMGDAAAGAMDDALG